MNLTKLVNRMKDCKRTKCKYYCAVTLRDGERLILQLRENIDFTSCEAYDIITVKPIIYTTHLHLKENRAAILEALNQYLGTDFKTLKFDTPRCEF